ncbi:hypothetical protein ALC56_00735, partial [Trachymyrmex septentrionalis]
QIMSDNPKRKRCRYSADDVKTALSAIIAGMSINAASKQYNIPRSTLDAKQKHLYADKKPGPSIILSKDKETALVEWILHLNRKNFPIIKNNLLTVYKCKESENLTFRRAKVTVTALQKKENVYSIVGNNEKESLTVLFYIANLFYLWLIQNNIPLPIILYIDDHSSHMTKNLNNFCNTHGIELVAFYPNVTHILQPMDGISIQTFKISLENYC